MYQSTIFDYQKKLAAFPDLKSWYFDIPKASLNLKMSFDTQWFVVLEDY